LRQQAPAFLQKRGKDTGFFIFAKPLPQFFFPRLKDTAS